MKQKITYRYNGPAKSKGPIVIGGKEKLWLKRMVLGEGGWKCSDYKAAALCWAIVNRWFLWPGAKYYPTFISMMRAFSQPINPRWMTGGDLARKYVGRNAASKERLARRDSICKETKFPFSIVSIVNLFSLGLVPYNEPQRISNWASLPSTPEKHPWGFDVDGDWFFEDKNIKPGFVSVEKE